MPLYQIALSVMLAGIGFGSGDRVIFLGDSITDGDTYRLLVEQALKEAHKPLPKLINKGIGGDTAAKMLARLDRDVLTQNPKHVYLSCGVNDTVTPDEFKTSITEIANKLKDKQIGLTLMTPEIPGGTNPEAEARHDKYDAIMHDLATSQHLNVAEVGKQMKTERSAGATLIGEDTVHPNYAGSRSIARAVLDSMGYRDVPVPSVLKPEPIPGIIRKWTIRALPDGAPKSISLPLQVQSKEWWSQPNGVWWKEQERQRGFALDLNDLVGKQGTIEASTSIQMPSEAQAVFVLGAAISSVHLNGQELTYQNKFGWHAGKDRIEVTLKKGWNEIIIQCDGSFFLSVEKIKS